MIYRLDQIKNWIFSQGEKVAGYQTVLSSFQAIGPENNGPGEAEKAEYIKSLFDDYFFELFNFNAPDERVKAGSRPNFAAVEKGEYKKTLWLFAHMDVVPAGDPELWESDPWTVRREGDLLYGRGVEDNQQAICSMLLLADCIKELQIRTDIGLGLVFMSDEENGSDYGLKWILKEAGDLFKPSDMYIVPDGGSPDGSLIEIAEKGQLWIKFTVKGKQCHASSPQNGNNSLVGASRLVLELSKLSQLFPEKNSLFIPPFSTFIPTRHEENTGAINILPGKDVFYLDCRILPGINPGKVKDACRNLADMVAGETGLKIEMEIVHEQNATMISEDSPVICQLAQAIYNVYNVKARAAGIGGATVAAMLREKNLPAVVWSCLLNTCHQPNEHSSILACMRDAAVFAEMLAQV